MILKRSASVTSWPKLTLRQCQTALCQSLTLHPRGPGPYACLGPPSLGLTGQDPARLIGDESVCKSVHVWECRRVPPSVTTERDCVTRHPWPRPSGMESARAGRLRFHPADVAACDGRLCLDVFTSAPAFICLYERLSGLGTSPSPPTLNPVCVF